MLCTRMHRYCIPRHGWTSPTTRGRCCSLRESLRRAACGIPLWKSSIMGLTPACKSCGFRSYPGSFEHLAWSHHARRGGFRFPCVGIWTKTAVLAQTGYGPQTIWDRYHGCEDTFELLATRAQLLPPHVCSVLERLAFELWRWQQGSCIWREPWMVQRCHQDPSRGGSPVHGRCGG